MNTLKFVTGIALIFCATKSFAWNAHFIGDAPVRWHSDSNTTGFKLQRSSFPVSSSERRAINDVIANLNANPSLIQIRLNGDTDWVSVGNGVNEIWFTDNQLVLSGAPAICISHFNPFAFGIWNLMEADVIFDSNVPYTSSISKSLHWFYGGGNRSIRSTALHEMGHALGLQHENRLYNIMGEDFTHVYANDNFVISGRGEDASEALFRMYGGRRAGPPDVAVTHWKYLNSDGEYSRHQKTVVYSGGMTAVTNYMEAPGGLDPGQQIFQVNPGQFVFPEFTFENNGPLDANISVSYFISTNTRITNSDRLVGFAPGRTIRRDMPETSAEMRIRIPADLLSGTRYYIGVIVDSGESLAESDERNNATFIPIDVL